MFDYFNDIARAHAVDPLLFIVIYAISTVPFLFVSGWLVHHIRKQKPLAVLLFFWALFYSAPYIYLLIVGRDMPLWMYLLVAVLIIGGLGLAARGLKQRIERDSRY